eukprot:720049-Pelagomonas_calceolata.AAC.5
MPTPPLLPVPTPPPLPLLLAPPPSTALQAHTPGCALPPPPPAVVDTPEGPGGFVGGTWPCHALSCVSAAFGPFVSVRASGGCACMCTCRKL